jgi:phosphatidylinositol 4-kinase
MDITLQLTDDYAVRNEIVTQLYGVARQWLTLAISRAPIEVQSTLQVGSKAVLWILRQAADCRLT